MANPNNSSNMKQKNRAAILRLIRAEELSRAELARRTGLTRAAVSLIVDTLLSEGLILEGDAVKSGSGRHPTSLQIAPQARYAAGVDISREGCHVGIVDLCGRLLQQCFIQTQETPQKTVDLAAAELKKMMQTAKDFLGVGICVPGPVDTVSGTILLPPGLETWHNFNVVKAFEQQLKLPVFLEKDANALALAEKNHSGISGSFLFLLADHGLGCGFVQNGHLYKGCGGFGCELGHVSLDYNGPLCSCGNRGCAELYASIPATLRAAGQESWSELTSLAEAGDTACRNALEMQAEMLAHACVGAVNMLEPDAIVLGGELVHGGFVLREQVEKHLAERCMTRFHHRVEVLVSGLPEQARTIAATGLALEDFFLKG